MDGCLTICHRILLHENLGEAHRKHAYQLMANELKIGHVKVSLLYMVMQLVVSLGFIYLCPDSVRLVVQFVSMGLMFWSMGILHWNMWWVVLIALIVCVGATNVINFMDGINGITAGYSLAVLLPLVLLNQQLDFMEPSFLVVAILGVLVFCLFNFRPKGKAKCFAGDVGSIGIAFIMLFAIGKLVVMTGDVTYLIF